MRRRTLPVLHAHGGFSRLSYAEWGDPSNPRVLVCVHGLTRNSHDFDYLARALAATYRVICPDLPGRGDSDWLIVKNDYCLPTYLHVMSALLGRLDVERVDWLGTSLGGLIGMALAATPGNPVNRLILNDIGPVMPVEPLKMIAAFVGSDPRFDNMEDGESFLRHAQAGFGITKTDHWAHMAEYSIVPAVDGGYRLNYDPGIAAVFNNPQNLQDIELWPVWDSIACPTLLLRGKESALLPRDVADEMGRRGPPMDFIEFPECGHAPSLYEVDQISAIQTWLG